MINGYLGNNVEVIGIRQWLDDIPLDESTLALHGRNVDEVQEYTKDFRPQIGDYIIKYVNVRDFWGTIRAVNPSNAYSYTSALEKKGYTLELLDKSENIRKSIKVDNNDIQMTHMESGYALYRIVDLKYSVVGIDIDGWTGKEWEIQNYKYGLNLMIEVRDGSSVYLDLPNIEFEIWINNELMGMMRVVPGEKILLDEILKKYNVTGLANLRVVVKDTFIPSEILGTGDTRELGMNVVLQ